MTKAFAVGKGAGRGQKGGMPGSIPVEADDTPAASQLGCELSLLSGALKKEEVEEWVDRELAGGSASTESVDAKSIAAASSGLPRPHGDSRASVSPGGHCLQHLCWVLFPER